MMNSEDINVGNELLAEISDYLQLDAKRYDGGTK